MQALRRLNPAAPIMKKGGSFVLAFLLILGLRFCDAQDPQGGASAVLPDMAQSPLAPAFYIYGDSTVDVGNNNYLRTLARANLPPYGKDFDTHEATGRFCNGRLSIDYLAKYMGLPYPAPFLSGLNTTTMLQGANFASAGAGILSESGGDLGQHIPLVEQVQQISNFHEELSYMHGVDAAHALLSESVHYISIGSNDFIHYYLRNVSGVESNLTPLEFNDLLVATLASQLKLLYGIGVRKMVVVGIGPLGCAPYFLFEDQSSTGNCITDINFMIKEYNSALRVQVSELYDNHADLSITFCDIFEALNPIVHSPISFGFQTASTACCGVGRYGGWIMCLIPDMACVNATSHVWWDEFHPTERANEFLARSIWSGETFPICRDMTLEELVTTPVPNVDFCAHNPTDLACTSDGELPEMPPV